MATLAPITSKSWTINPNVRNAFVSLNDMAAWWMFNNFDTLRQRGWTVKYTCDGTTGPTSGSDHTNRLASKANCTTRGAAAGNAQSFGVLTNADGVDLMLTYQGASDDILRISYSPGGLFTPAGTSNQQPTATDEVVISNGNTIVNATASLDRVMSIWTSDDTKAWSMALFRSNAIVNVMGLELVTDLCTSGVFVPKPYVGYRMTNVNRGSGGDIGTPVGGVSGTAVGTAGHLGMCARVTTAATSRITRVGGGEITIAPLAGNVCGVGAVFQATPPALQAGVGSPLFPIYWSGEKAANLDGFIGYPIDWWQMITSSLASPAAGDFTPGYEVGDTPGVSSQRTNWFVSLGSAMTRPWKNAAVSLERT